MVIKNNKGFILVMTLVMALIMLVVALVCLKIFLAPYIAIQTDIIKKKEFYMADTAIEVVREQISNIFYNTRDTYRYQWERGENNKNIDKYFTESLQEEYRSDFKLFEKEGHGNDLLNEDWVIEKYNGNICGYNFKDNDENNNKYGNLPRSIGKNATKMTIVSSTITKWIDWSWKKDRKAPLRGADFSNEVLDRNLTVTVWIEPVLIKDTDLSVVNLSTSDVQNDRGLIEYNTSNNKFLASTSTAVEYFLPKELQSYNSSDLFGGYKQLIKEKITRRDFAIVAISTYTRSDIKCEMKYYFSLISFSPKKNDHATKFIDINIEDGDLRPIYRLYFRKFEYNWTED